jgi:UDP-N-acetylmuramate dehydrogenase
VYRNPTGDSAGRLLEAAGLKGLCRGGAQFSLVHANFIVNMGGAAAEDVLALMNMARARVFDRFDVALEPEIVFAGDWPQFPVLGQP